MHRTQSLRVVRLAWVLLFLAPSVGAQVGTWQQRIPANAPSLRAVDMLSGLEGWAGGGAGHLRRTANLGTNWLESELPTSDLRTLAFANASLGWAAGQGIFRTTDAGGSWVFVSAASGVNRIESAGAGRVHAAGDGERVYRSSDGGANWSVSVLGGGSADLLAISFAGQSGWTVGEAGRIYRSDDSGLTWQAQASGTASALTDVVALGVLEAWVAAGDTLLHTTDGGASWQQVGVPAPVTDLCFLAGDFGWGAGPGGSVIRTQDGGASWTVQLAAGGPALRSIDMGDLFAGLAVGDAGTIYRTFDGGASWELIAGSSIPSSPHFECISAVDMDHVWAAAFPGDVWRSVDGGATFTALPALPNSVIFGMEFADTQSGYLCAERGSFYDTIAWTHDGGESWSSISSAFGFNYTDVAALNPQRAVVCGGAWIRHTTDGGASWSFFTPQPLGDHEGVDFADSFTGWLVGTRIYRSDDGGDSWTQQLDPPVRYLDVAAVSPLVAWAVGHGGAILKTTDGGASWQPQASGTTTALLSIAATDPQNAWIAGQGFLARTQDGGASWQRETLPMTGTDFHPRSLSFVDAEQGWLAGLSTTGLWRRAIVPAPCEVQGYCSAKTTSQGGLPLLSSEGAPSASAGNFSISVAGGIPGQFGVLFRGAQGPANLPFLGGTLCVQTPVVRLGVQQLGPGGGTTYPIAVTADLIGATRWYQFWFRDPVHPDGTGAGLSDGLMVRFCD